MLKNTKVYHIGDEVNIRVKVFSIVANGKITKSILGSVIKIISPLIKTNLIKYSYYPERLPCVSSKLRLVVKLKKAKGWEQKPYVIITIDKMKPENKVRVFRC